MYNKRILFVGIPDMAYVCLDGLVDAHFNIVGVVGPKKNHNTYFQFKRYVNDLKLQFLEYDDLNDEFFLNKLRALKPDVAVVSSFNYKIPKAMLDIPRDGFINIHPSLLPKYRGGNPYSTVLINGDMETGVTLHLMDEGFDTGNILMQRHVEISPYETMGTLFNKTNFLAIQMLIELLQEYEEEGKLTSEPQPEGNFEQGKSLNDADLFINFDQKPEVIERFVRALNPFLNASCMFRGVHVKVYSVEVAYDFQQHNIESGRIAKIENNKIFIACKGGYVIPTVMQYGSFFIADSKKFIEAVQPTKGEMFVGI